MSKSSLVFVPLVLVIMVGLLIMGGWAIHRIGWTEGYAVGAALAAGEANPVPYAPTGLSYVGLFLTAGLAFLILVAFTGKLLSLWAFRGIAGSWMRAHAPMGSRVAPHGEDWAAHWHRYHRHVPPWWYKGQPGDTSPEGEQCEAPGDSGAAGA
jgi:hypothetical protein